jgi:hypothetical protein
MRAPIFSVCFKLPDGGWLAAVQGKPYNGALADSLLLESFVQRFCHHSINSRPVRFG